MNALLRYVTLGIAVLTVVARAPAQTYTVIKTFTGGTNDRGSPNAGLALSNGVLYGTATFGGTWNGGTLFRVNTNGSGFAVLTNFDGTHGRYPAADLVLSEGTIYGVATNGGTHNGVIFKCNLDGSGYTIIEDFASSISPANPRSGLLLSGGTLYGTMFLGLDYGGSVFSLSTNGSNYKVIHSFTNINEGNRPWCTPVLSGNTLYGTTQFGGISNNGTIFKVNVDGTGYAILKQFTGADGIWPEAGLVLSGDTLYGTTYWYAGGAGTVFKINTNGSGFTVLKYFTGSGSGPAAKLLLSNGVLYGTTFGYNYLSPYPKTNYGTVFQINTDGSGFNVLKTFTGTATDACCLDGSLLLSGRTLYGTASAGGTNNGSGVVFALTLPPPTLAAERLGNSAVFRWDDPTFALQAAPTPNGTFTNVPGASSPYTNPINGSQQYFRLKGN